MPKVFAVSGIRQPKTSMVGERRRFWDAPFRPWRSEQSNEHRFLRERVMEDKAFTDLEVVRYRKERNPVYISLSTAPLRDPNGTICGLLGLMADMTQRKQADLQLNQSRDQLRALMTRLHSAREEEGTRIAREVHDELGQAMTSLKLDLSWVARRLSLPETADSREQMLERIQGAMQQLSTRRSMPCGQLPRHCGPASWMNSASTAALEWQTRDFEKRTGIRCTWSSAVGASSDRTGSGHSGLSYLSGDPHERGAPCPGLAGSHSAGRLLTAGSPSKSATMDEASPRGPCSRTVPSDCLACGNGLRNGVVTFQSLEPREREPR